MRFFNKNLVFVLFLFIVSCDDGFNEKAYKKDKNQKPNRVTYEKEKVVNREIHNTKNEKIETLSQKAMNKKADEDKTEEINANTKASDDKVEKINAEYDRKTKKIGDEYSSSQKPEDEAFNNMHVRYGVAIDVKFDELDKNTKASDDKVEEINAKYERIKKAISDGTYTNNPADYE